MLESIVSHVLDGVPFSRIEQHFVALYQSEHKVCQPILCVFVWEFVHTHTYDTHVQRKEGLFLARIKDYVVAHRKYKREHNDEGELDWLITAWFT